VSVPSHPFELLVYGKDRRVTFHEFATLFAAVEAARSLKPSLVNGFRLSICLVAMSFKQSPTGEIVRRE
jgi:hypothetical protein